MNMSKTKMPFLLLVLFFVKISHSQINIWDENLYNSQVKLDSLLNLLPNAKKGNERTVLLNQLAEIYWFIDPDKTIEYASKALQLSRSNNNKNQEGLALINLCQGYLLNDLYDEALRYAMKSLEIRKEIGNNLDLAFTLRTLGWLYYDIGYYDRALEYHKEVLQMHQEIGDKQRIAYSYNSIGLIHEKKGDCKMALTFFKRSLELKRPFNNKDRISETMTNMGVCYLKIGDLDSAKQFLEESLVMANQIGDEQIKVEILNQLAIVNLKIKNYDISLELLDEARFLLEEFKDNKEWLTENNRIRSDYYLEIGNYKEALISYKKYKEVETDIFSNDKSQKLTEMRVLYEAERSEIEIKLLEQQRNLETQKRQGVILVTTLLVILGLLIILSLHNNIKKNRALFEHNEKLSKEQLKTQLLLKEKLENKLDFKMKELTNLALFISQRSSLYKELIKSFKSIDFKDINEIRKKVSSLIKEYSFKLNFNEDIKRFHINIENLQNDFVFRLKEKYPDLTEKEIQLAVQVKMKLSSKEISNINNISLSSVEIARHRLRKKLDLNKSDSLAEVLGNI